MDLLAKVQSINPAPALPFGLCFIYAPIADCLGGSWPGPTEHQQVIGDDAQPDPALHPALPAVPAPP
jgi:hypothetical protein